MIARYLLHHPRIVLLILVTITIAGSACFVVMPRMEDPVLRQRVAVVSTTLPGGNALEIESTVTIPIEKCLNEFSEIKQVRSNVRTNITNTVIELKDNVNDTDEVWSSIKTKLQSVADQLPEQCETPQLTVFPLKAYTVILALRNIERPSDQATSNNNDPNRLAMLRPLATELQSRILHIQTTEKVDIFGDPGEEYTVLVEPQTLVKTGLSTAAIAQQIKNSLSGPGGSAENADSTVLLGIKDNRDLASIIGDIYLDYRPDQQPVALSDLATIKKQLTKPFQSQAIVDKSDAIVLGVMVENSARVDLWAQQFDEVIEQFKLDFPGQFEVVSLFSQAQHINDRMNNLKLNLTISTVAIVLVTLLMMGWRSMIVVAASLPLSALIVFCGLRILDIPIHQMSVTGLIVALGLLIDNAIVMVEEVRSRVFAGADFHAAINSAVSHLRMPLFVSTLTTVLAFLPIAMMQGPSGEFVGSIAISVILAISASFVLAITLVPVLVALLSTGRPRQGMLERGFHSNLLLNLYQKSLHYVVRYPMIGIACGVLLPLIGFFSASDLQRQFFPSTDRRQIQVEIELPAAATHDALLKSVDQVKRIIAQHPNVQSQNWFLGHSAPTFYYNVIPRRMNTPAYAQAFIDLRGDVATADIVSELQAEIDAQTHQCRVVVQQLQQGPPFDAPVEIRVTGNDLEILQRLGDQVRRVLAKTNHVVHTRCDQQDTIPMLELDIEQSVLQQSRLTQRDISNLLYTSTEGADAGSVIDDGQETPIRVKLNFAGRTISQTLAALPVPSQQTQMPTQPAEGQQPRDPSPQPTLGSFGRFQLSSDTAAILRFDGDRVNEIKAYIDPNVLPSVVLDEFKSRLSKANFKLPEGYSIEFGGESEKRSQAVSGLIANAVILFSIMVLALVAVLGSFRKMLTIALVGGLAIGLGPFALYCFGFPFGFMAIVGTMGLVGVAINDSIVVLAAISANNKLPADSRQKLEDVVIGCTRHVVTTTLTTMLGFLPLVINGGKFWPPLAIVISAGVGGATLLALYFVPALSSFMQGETKPSEPDTA